MSRARHVRELHRRLMRLRQTVIPQAERNGLERQLTWMRAEAAALEWALARLDAPESDC